MRWFTPTTRQLVLLVQYRDRLLEDIDRMEERKNTYHRCNRRKDALSEVREISEVREVEKRMDEFNCLVAALLGVKVFSTLGTRLPLSRVVRMWYTEMFSVYVNEIRPKLD